MTQKIESDKMKVMRALAAGKLTPSDLVEATNEHGHIRYDVLVKNLEGKPMFEVTWHDGEDGEYYHLKDGVKIPYTEEELKEYKEKDARGEIHHVTWEIN